MMGQTNMMHYCLRRIKLTVMLRAVALSMATSCMMQGGVVTVAAAAAQNMSAAGPEHVINGVTVTIARSYMISIQVYLEICV